MKCDFHMHSVYSDGSESVESIFKEAKKQHIDALALSDHDTVFGIPEAASWSKWYAIELIPAIELTACEENLKFHVLGYGINYLEPELVAYSTTMLKQLNKKTLKQIKLIQAQGIAIPEEVFWEEAQGKPLYRAKLLGILAKYGWIKEEEIMERIKPWFGEGGCYYVPEEIIYPGYEEIVKMIHRAGGVAVLAHPEKVKKKNESLYYTLITHPMIDGLEVFHPSNSLEVQEALLKICQERSLLITGGSDYHGAHQKKKITVGEQSVPDYVYENLRHLILQ